MFKSFLVLVLSLGVSSTSALVDYSAESESFDDAPAIQMKRKRPSPRKVSRRRSAGSGAATTISLDSNYKSVSIDTNDSQLKGKVGIVSMHGRLDTPYHFYLDMSYWQGSTSIKDISTSSEQQKGNPKFILGLNWLQFGDGANAMKVDIYGGASFKAKESYLGHSRNDKIVGLQTSKRFNEIVIMLGGEYVLTGNVDNPDDMNIGNISQLSAALGWVVSNDIRFAVEANKVKVAAAKTGAVGDALENDFGFTTLTPSLFLGIAPAVELQLGAVFRTKKAQLPDTGVEKQDLTKAKLMEYPGSYGNSLFAGLKIAI